ncbi:hypothetical protein Fmac_022643 [Flemingia macrophylla]|uniref:Uncharacterized protein n=1 Tax=Flemingia macrophylla TaxID=520843 RepID=A0ABD1M0C0_9FABA
MSNENFEAMRAKAKECEDLVEKKEAIVMAELQQIYARKNEVDRKVETNLKAIKETKAAIETTLWSAEMADSAKAAIEIKLMRYHQQQQKIWLVLVCAAVALAETISGVARTATASVA